MPADPELDALLERLRGLARQRLRLRVEAGFVLREIRRATSYNDWVTLVLKAGAGYRSKASIYRDMLLSEIIEKMGGPDVVDLLDMHTTATAILAAHSAGEEVIGMIADAAHNGVPVKVGDVPKLERVAQFSAIIAERVVDGEQGLNTAHAVVEAAETLNSEAITDMVAAYGASSPDVVTTLASVREHRPELFAEIEQSGAVFNPITNQSVRLCDVSASDLIAAANMEDVERMQRQHDRLTEWAERRNHKLLVVQGRFDKALKSLSESLDDLRPEGELTIVVYERTPCEQNEEQPVAVV